MGKGRLEAFSDGVFAIIITIMVLELRVPRGNDLAALKPILPVFTSYVLSFVNVGIYWNNHHHMLQAVQKVNGKVLWANIHLLFWLSIIPFGTAWMGENDFAAIPVALYGAILLMAGASYTILAAALINANGRESKLAKALGETDWKGIMSLVLYAAGISLSFVNHWLGFSFYLFVAAMWFIPDRRVEKLTEA